MRLNNDLKDETTKHNLNPFEKEETKLVASLEAMTGQHIEPLYYVDPSLIGGMVIQIGDKLIDGSLRRQLRDMQHKLLQADVTNGVTDE